MLDIRFVRDNKSAVEKLLKNRQIVGVSVDHILEIDDERKRLLKEVETLNIEKKKAAEARSKEKGRKIKEGLAKKEAALAAIEEEFRKELYKIPNTLLEGVPI